MSDGAGSNTERPRRRDIEGLRAVAILLVAGYHAGVPGFSGGYVGVDVFFVISGYLITWLLVEEVEMTGRLSFARFYARRARRLLPALAVMLIVVAGAAALVYAPFEQGRLAATALATALYVSNLYFARFSTDYGGADAATNPLLHTWSLSVEEQFYLLWPLLVWFALRPGGKPGRRRLLVWLGVMAAVSFAMCLYLTTARQPWAFFLSPTRAWEFAAGAFAVLIPESRSAGRRAAYAWLGLGGILASSVLLHDALPFPGPAALLPVLATALLLRAGLASGGTVPGRLLGTNVFQQIGRLSYSWYLWHWPVLVIAGALFGATTLGWRLALLVVSLALADVSFRVVEHPIRRHAALASRPSLSLVMAAVLTVGATAIALGWGALAERWAHGPGQERFTSARETVSTIYGEMDCDVGLFDTGVKVCSFGPAGAPAIVLFGDSHAGQWFRAVEILARERGRRLVVVTKSACPPVDAPLFSELMGREFSECAAWRAGALRRIRQIAPDLVIVSTSIGYELSVAEWEMGTESVMRALRGEGSGRPSRKVVLLRDTPSAGFDVLTCAARAAWRPAFLPRAACDVRLAEGDDPSYAAQRAGAERAGAAVVDMNGYVRAGVAARAGAGAPVFRDAGHLSVAFVESLAGALAGEVDARLSAR
jgi:peptidoglycan/LPS O-acetylase OafA/YrhL